MRVAVSLFVAGIVAATAAFQATVPVASATPATIAHVAGLPPGVVAALGLSLADPGRPYRASDAVGTGATLPTARLIWARHDGTAWRIHYERGGRGHYYGLATLRPVATGWAVATQRGFTPQPPPNTP